MELRKIQQTISGTFFVCLPKDWAERNRLNKGVPIAISETADGRLVLDAKYDVERAPQVVVIKPTPILEREIIGNYLLGYDIIRVEAEERMSPGDRERVKQASSRLIGLEIIEEDYSRIVMQCLLEPSAFPPEKILRREYSIASGMHRDAVTALIESDMHLAKNVIARDNEVNRLYFLLVRILRTVIQNPGLSEKLEIRPIDCLDYRLTASLVESIGDHSAQMAETTVRLEDVKIRKELSQLMLRFHKVVYDSHENALKALFSHDTSLAEAVRAEREKVSTLFHEIETMAHDQPIEVAPHILSAASSMSRIYEHSVDIADLVMPRPA
ncbi:MAG: PhoU domain protein [Candidatus Bathyarchaeota archaeon BA1]|nr:MAG: PhoU domain protein [Candidatus Bathyarchaeota archaeon BA1]